MPRRTRSGAAPGLSVNDCPAQCQQAIHIDHLKRIRSNEAVRIRPHLMPKRQCCGKVRPLNSQIPIFMAGMPRSVVNSRLKARPQNR